MSVQRVWCKHKQQSLHLMYVAFLSYKFKHEFQDETENWRYTILPEFHSSHSVIPSKMII